jgi:hypothetical protein
MSQKFSLYDHRAQMEPPPPLLRRGACMGCWSVLQQRKSQVCSHAACDSVTCRSMRYAFTFLSCGQRRRHSRLLQNK